MLHFFFSQHHFIFSLWRSPVSNWFYVVYLFIYFILFYFISFYFILEDLHQHWIFWRTGLANWRGPFVRNDIQNYSTVLNGKKTNEDQLIVHKQQVHVITLWSNRILSFVSRCRHLGYCSQNLTGHYQPSTENDFEKCTISSICWMSSITMVGAFPSPLVPLIWFFVCLFHCGIHPSKYD